MNLPMTQAADEFIEILKEVPEIASFIAAQSAMEASAELSELRSRYDRAVQEFQEKRMKGSLSQKDIDELKKLQKEIQSHILWQNFMDRRSEAVALLRELNSAMGEVLGFDFASAAASSAGC